jgi:ribosomal protein S18 acetylase RimI-like enzyme
MLDDIVIEPMTDGFILWRCLHRGPLSRETIDKWPPDEAEFWETRRVINVPLLRKIIKVYGTCAMLARDGDRIVGTLRFYPKILFSMEGAGSSLCLLQAFPDGVSECLVENRFPPLEEIQEKTLRVHCWAIAPSFREKNPFQPEGFGTRMAQELVRWARENGWEGIEVTAYEDTEVLNVQIGMPGRRFWDEFGFRVVRTDTETASWFLGILDTMREQVVAQGLNPKDAQNRYTMRYDAN